jgi:hypothetical protein
MRMRRASRDAWKLVFFCAVKTTVNKGDDIMRKRVSAALVAACLSGGLLWAADPAPQASFPQGIVAKELNDQQDVRKVITQATNAALTKGGFNDVLERLSTEDRNRFKDLPKQDTTELDGRVAQIQKIWKEKYGKAFDADDKVFNSFVVIREGEISDPAVAKMHWPVNAFDRTDDDAMKASSTNSGDYLKKGRNVAIATIPASHGEPGLNLSMLHEPVDDWRVDIPDSISRDQIFNNLKDRLTYFGENVDKWPADVNEAYRGMAHCVMAALENVPRASESAKRVGEAPFPATPAR